MTYQELIDDYLGVLAELIDLMVDTHNNLDSALKMQGRES